VDVYQAQYTTLFHSSATRVAGSNAPVIIAFPGQSGKAECLKIIRQKTFVELHFLWIIDFYFVIFRTEKFNTGICPFCGDP